MEWYCGGGAVPASQHLGVSAWACGKGARPGSVCGGCAHAAGTNTIELRHQKKAFPVAVEEEKEKKEWARASV